MKFLDQAKIYLKSGNGGPGCLSFRREKYIPKGGPDGGNGGRGGDIIFEAVDTLNTLIDFRFQQHYKADNGRPGEGSNRSGASAQDKIIKVPVGTQILDEDQETVLADLMETGDRLTFLKGGDGGMGNAHYKSSTNQAPRKTTPGYPGQEITVWLQLKLIADVGLVGLPNAGKSTLLSVCSKAKPKIADYPFTTLEPKLGVAKIGDDSFVMADIPGLIEGAHQGKGLGDKFLGHVERTSVLVHVIDGTQEDVVEAYKTIRGELTEYGHGLADKPEIIALNKIDALQDDEIKEKTAALEKQADTKIYPISAAANKNIEPVLYKLSEVITKSKHGEKEDTSYSPIEDI